MVRSMVRLLLGELPAWMRRDHPALRQELGTAPPTSRGVRFGRALSVEVSAVAVLMVGYVIATGLLTHPAGQTLSESVSAVVFFPLVALQIVTGILALTSTSIGRQRRDAASELGQPARDRAGRVAGDAGALDGGVLPTARAGRRDRRRAGGADRAAADGPEPVSGALRSTCWSAGSRPKCRSLAAVLLVALTLTAGLLLPLTAVGLDAAVGLLLAATVQQRTYSTLIQTVLIVLRLVVMLALLVAAARLARWADRPAVGCRRVAAAGGLQRLRRLGAGVAAAGSIRRNLGDHALRHPDPAGADDFRAGAGGADGSAAGGGVAAGAAGGVRWRISRLDG